MNLNMQSPDLESSVNVDAEAIPLVIENKSTSHYVLIEIIQLLPSLLAWTLLNLLHDGVITLLAFQLYIGTIPFIYSHFNNIDLQSLLGAKMRSPKVQLKKGVIAGSVLLFSMLIAFFAIFNQITWIKEMMSTLNIPIRRNKAIVFIFCIVFSFVNPLLEEIFWRVFLSTCLKGREYLVTFHYALYHLFAIQYLIGNWPLGILGTIGIYVLGRIFEHFHNSDGLIASVITHACVDWVATIIFLYLYNRVPDALDDPNGL